MRIPYTSSQEHISRHHRRHAVYFDPRTINARKTSAAPVHFNGGTAENQILEN
jgi:hypothetical protein